MIPPIPPCLIWGDSIAAGVATRYPICAAAVRVGAPTSEIARWSLPPHGGVAVVSAGSNDPASRTLDRDMRIIRARIAGKVIWIVPNAVRASDSMRRACRSGDRAVFLSSLPSRDGVHPRSYATLAEALDKAEPCR